MPVSLAIWVKWKDGGSSWSRHKPEVRRWTKCKDDLIIAPWDGVGDSMSDLIEGYIIDTELPNKIFYIRDMFLVWLSCKEGFK